MIFYILPVLAVLCYIGFNIWCRSENFKIAMQVELDYLDLRSTK